MSSESPTKKSQSIEEWEHRLDNVKVNKQDLNRLVMNYLVIEGYKDAAEQFSLESGVSPSLDLESIQERMEIRHAIQSGDIDTAIGLVNDVNPEILDTDPQLFFHLQQQRLIEMIRVGDYAGALEFATEEMAPRGIEHPEFLEELERTMALFAFPDMHKSPVAELLHASQRQKTAGELNAAILLSQSREKNPRLPELLRLLTWSQEQLDDRMTYPRIEDFCSAKLVVRDGEGNIVDDAIDSTVS